MLRMRFLFDPPAGELGRYTATHIITQRGLIMHRMLRADTPILVRIICALAICIAALYSALIAAMYSGRPTVATVLIATGLASLGVLALAIASTPRHPRLPLQMALAFTIGAALVVFLGMPLPPTETSVGSQISCVIIAALAVTAAASGSRRPARAFALLVGLAVVGVLLALILVSLALRTDLPSTARFPVWQVALIIGGSVASVWHGRTLHRDASGRLPRAAV
jgi:hypothetical protein